MIRQILTKNVLYILQISESNLNSHSFPLHLSFNLKKEFSQYLRYQIEDITLTFNKDMIGHWPELGLDRNKIMRHQICCFHLEDLPCVQKV